jgi:hypothetical protein
LRNQEVFLLTELFKLVCIREGNKIRYGEAIGFLWAVPNILDHFSLREQWKINPVFLEHLSIGVTKFHSCTALCAVSFVFLFGSFLD